jgi:sodium-dependent phosphate transporter
MFLMGPLLFTRPTPADSQEAKVSNYAVIQEEDDLSNSASLSDYDPKYEGKDAITPPADQEKIAVTSETKKLAYKTQSTYKELMAAGDDKLCQKLLQKRGPLGWAMRTLRDNPMGAGELYEFHNVKIVAKRIPAYIVCGALYGLHYDIHAAQTGHSGTPEGDRMARVY